MSPEQVAGLKDIDHRSDLYSLGCVVYECLTGSPPYEHPDDRLVLGMHQRGTIPDVHKRRRDTPPPLAKLVTKSLAKQPGQRWQSAVEMRTALAACANAPSSG
jgi:serine/threonine-protein kinase